MNTTSRESRSCPIPLSVLQSDLVLRNKSHSLTGIVALIFVMAAGHDGAAGQEAAPSQASTAPAVQESVSENQLPPRQTIERTIAPIVDLLKDQSVPEDQKVADLNGIVRDRVDFATLSKLMIGQSWDSLSPQQHQAFIDEFSQHLMGVYLPMMTQYNGQQVQVVNDRPESRGDHTVITKVSDRRGGKERQVALIACRMRQGDRGWRVIDLTVEGISVGGLFAAQLRPVLAREGFDGLLKRLHEKNAERSRARQRR